MKGSLRGLDCHRHCDWRGIVQFYEQKEVSYIISITGEDNANRNERGSWKGWDAEGGIATAGERERDGGIEGCGYGGPREGKLRTRS